MFNKHETRISCILLSFFIMRVFNLISYKHINPFKHPHTLLIKSLYLPILIYDSLFEVQL